MSMFAAPYLPGRLQPWNLRVVCVADRCPKPTVQLAALEDHLLGMHRLDGIQRDAELAGILDVHHETIRRYAPDRAELLTPIGHERLVPDFDRLSHDPLSWDSEDRRRQPYLRSGQRLRYGTVLLGVE